MLVLSRYRDEKIIIGDNIIITVVDIRGDKVKLGIEAPKNISVHRQEIYEAIKEQERIVNEKLEDKTGDFIDTDNVGRPNQYNNVAIYNSFMHGLKEGIYTDYMIY